MKPSSSHNSAMKLSLSSLPKPTLSGESGTLGSFPEPVWKALLAHLGASSPGDLRSIASLNKELSCLVREVMSSTPRRSIIRASRPTSARIHKRPSAHRRTISSVISSQQKMPKTEINESLRNVNRGSPPSPPPNLADRSILKPPRLKSEKKSKKKKKNQSNQSGGSSQQAQIIPAEVTTLFLRHLHDEVNQYVQSIREAVAAKITPKAESMTRRIELLTKYLWHNAHVEVYGSMATGLALPTSDLDLCIVGATFGPNGENPFDMLVTELRKQPWLDMQSFQPISTARTPVIKLVSQIENLHTDITFCDTVYTKPISRRNHMSHHLPGFFHRGLESRDLIRIYVKRMPMLVPLVIVLKQLLLPLGLNNSFQGGLSSFALVLLVVSFLQLHARDTPADQPHIIQTPGKGKGKKGKGANSGNAQPQLPQQQQPKPPKGTRLGDMVFRLLRYYAFFDYHKVGIDVTDGGHEFEITQAHYDAYGCIPPMVLLDPTDMTSNLTNNTFAMYRIKHTFMVAYEYLLAQSKDPRHHQHPHSSSSSSSSSSSPHVPLLANFFTSVQETAHSVSPRPPTPAIALPSSSSAPPASSCVLVPIAQTVAGPVAVSPPKTVK